MKDRRTAHARIPLENLTAMEEQLRITLQDLGQMHGLPLIAAIQRRLHHLRLAIGAHAMVAELGPPGRSIPAPPDEVVVVQSTCMPPEEMRQRVVLAHEELIRLAFTAQRYVELDLAYTAAGSPVGAEAEELDRAWGELVEAVSKTRSRRLRPVHARGLGPLHGEGMTTKPLNPDRSSACFALSSPVVGTLRCRLDVHHRGGHETMMGENVYTWWDEKDTTKHWDSPCECGAALRDHSALGDACPDRNGGQFRGRRASKTTDFDTERT